jgi:hypothetical protein
LTSPLDGGEWSVSDPGIFTHGERAPGAHWIGGWVDPRFGVDDVQKRKFLTLPGLELRPFGGPARSQSLYRLRYPGFRDIFISLIISKMHGLKYTLKGFGELYLTAVCPLARN